jgi:predicted GNAT family acetyltransferase
MDEAKRSPGAARRSLRAWVPSWRAIAQAFGDRITPPRSTSGGTSMTETYTNDQQMKRFELAIDGEVAAWVDYDVEPGVITLNHTEVLPGFRGRGLARDIVTYAFAHARVAGLRVTPRCSFVASFIERNSEYQDLVA